MRNTVWLLLLAAAVCVSAHVCVDGDPDTLFSLVGSQRTVATVNDMVEIVWPCKFTAGSTLTLQQDGEDLLFSFTATAAYPWSVRTVHRPATSADAQVGIRLGGAGISLCTSKERLCRLPFDPDAVARESCDDDGFFTTARLILSGDRTAFHFVTVLVVGCLLLLLVLNIGRLVWRVI